MLNVKVGQEVYMVTPKSNGNLSMFQLAQVVVIDYDSDSMPELIHIQTCGRKDTRIAFDATGTEITHFMPKRTIELNLAAVEFNRDQEEARQKAIEALRSYSKSAVPDRINKKGILLHLKELQAQLDCVKSLTKELK